VGFEDGLVPNRQRREIVTSVRDYLKATVELTPDENAKKKKMGLGVKKKRGGGWVENQGLAQQVPLI
jgi:hypothetical protein